MKYDYTPAMPRTTRRLSMLAMIVWMVAGAAWVGVSVIIKITTNSSAWFWGTMIFGVIAFLAANRGWANLEYTPEIQ